MIWYGLVAFVVLFLLTTLFRFTILQHDFYKKMADSQQKMIVKNPVSRGSISSSKESLNGVVAVSTNLGTLAIDPTQTGSTAKMLDFLGDAVMTEFCTHKSLEVCREKIGNYVREDLSAEKTLSKEDLHKKIVDYLKIRIDTPVESVFLAENLSDETTEKINTLNDPALFFVVNNLYVNPTKVTSSGALASRLSSILDIPEEDLSPKFAIRKKQHLEIIRKMSLITHDMVKDFMTKNREVTQKHLIEAQSQVKETSARNKLRDPILLEHAVYPFLKIEDNLVRYYPEGSALGQITGFVDSEGVGRYGIEWYFESVLQKESPTQLITKDLRGRPIQDYVSAESLTTQNGADISLTIDRNIQKEISKRLENAVQRFRANRGSVVVMDPKTGAITAMVNYPHYDPNQFTDIYEMEPVQYSDYPNPWYDLFGFPLFVIDSQSGSLAMNIEWKRVKMREATDDEVNNFAIQKFKYKNGYGIGNYQNAIISSLYEPGSVFKAITVAVGLDTGEIRPTDTYYDKNVVTLDLGGGAKVEIKNYSQAKCGGRHSYTHALNWSCNVGMIDIVEKVGRSLFDTYIRDFGFSSKTNITLDGETFRNLDPYEKWSRVRFFTMSFGQGIDMTMIQMAAAYSALANGGIYMQPYLVEAINYPNGKRIETIPMPLRRVIKEDTSKTITAMLVDGVRNGYAAAGGVAGYTMAGKTGTAQIPYKGTYENLYFRQAVGHTITSYGGYAPAYNPKFVMIVVLERPRTSADSEKTAALLYAEIAEYLLTYYKVPKWQN